MVPHDRVVRGNWNDEARFVCGLRRDGHAGAHERRHVLGGRRHGRRYRTDVRLTGYVKPSDYAPFDEITWMRRRRRRAGSRIHLKAIPSSPRPFSTHAGALLYEPGRRSQGHRLSPKQFASVGAFGSWCGHLVACWAGGKYLLARNGPCAGPSRYRSDFAIATLSSRREHLFITISQSGETADTLAAAREAKRKGAHVVSIVNVSAVRVGPRI